MKKILTVIAIGLTMLSADVTCISTGGGYYWCTDNDTGESWTMYQGE